MSNHKNNHRQSINQSAKKRQDNNNSNIYLTNDKNSIYEPFICSTTICSNEGDSTKDEQIVQLRFALCQAVQQNELLRQRVVQLESLFAESQHKLEILQKQFDNNHKKSFQNLQLGERRSSI